MSRFFGLIEEEIRKLWYDSHVHSRHSLDLLEKIVGNDRIVYGTNFAGWDQPETYEVDERSEGDLEAIWRQSDATVLRNDQEAA
mgnify:CR=1 FL=1